MLYEEIDFWKSFFQVQQGQMAPAAVVRLVAVLAYCLSTPVKPCPDPVPRVGFSSCRRSAPALWLGRIPLLTGSLALRPPLSPNAAVWSSVVRRWQLAGIRSVVPEQSSSRCTRLCLVQGFPLAYSAPWSLTGTHLLLICCHPRPQRRRRRGVWGRQQRRECLSCLQACALCQ